MILIRRTFFCKPGRAGQVINYVKDFTQITKELGFPIHTQRIATDLTGKTDRVVWEIEAEEFRNPREIEQRAMQHPEVQRLFTQLVEHIDGAEAEYFTLEFSG
jgi:hypothetical protein